MLLKFITKKYQNVVKTLKRLIRKLHSFTGSRLTILCDWSPNLKLDLSKYFVGLGLVI